MWGVHFGDAKWFERWCMAEYLTITIIFRNKFIIDLGLATDWATMGHGRRVLRALRLNQASLTQPYDCHTLYNALGEEDLADADTEKQGQSAAIIYCSRRWARQSQPIPAEQVLQVSTCPNSSVIHWHSMQPPRRSTTTTQQKLVHSSSISLSTSPEQ